MSHRPWSLFERDHIRASVPRRARAPEPSPNSQSAPPGTASSITVSSPRRRLERVARAMSQAQEVRIEPDDELPSILASLRNASHGTDALSDGHIYSIISARRQAAAFAEEDGESDSSATVPEEPEDEYPAARDMFLRMGGRQRRERQHAIDWARPPSGVALEQLVAYARDYGGRRSRQSLLLSYERAAQNDDKRGLRWRLTCGASVWDWRTSENEASGLFDSLSERKATSATAPSASPWPLGPPHPLPIHPEERLPRDACAPITRFPQQRTGCGSIIEDRAVQGDLDTNAWFVRGLNTESIRLVPRTKQPCGCQLSDAACAKCTKQLGTAFTTCEEHGNRRASTVMQFSASDIQATRIPLKPIFELPREKLPLDPGSVYW
ncbi:hypothetical protein BKA62DRAFT_95781 [Auriculariales sp. MPI-PUGE-AT-0066]|nr:hypothetical protein BKA62DRAFT_95781 [Auriculariales sp. MPI-PUGE-AT-0066]